MNILDQIIAAKRIRLAAARAAVTDADIRTQATFARAGRPAHALRSSLQLDGIRIIAEIKRRSPSKGELRPDLDPADIARDYEQGGAAAISVLTEEDFFGGSLDDLRSVREATNLPLLRKDFIIDEYQIFEAAAAGADAILLIVAALNDTELRQLSAVAESLGLDALVEVHTALEMERAVGGGARLIGVNNRNLQSFEVSLEVSFELAKMAPPESLLVTESGLTTGDDIRRLHAVGFRGFLIGETFMRAPQPGAALQSLLSR